MTTLKHHCRRECLQSDREARSRLLGPSEAVLAVTPEQIRPARELLKWSRERLTDKSEIQVRTLWMVETGRSKPMARTLAAIRASLEAAGVEFIEQDAGRSGVRLKGTP